MASAKKTGVGGEIGSEKGTTSHQIGSEKGTTSHQIGSEKGTTSHQVIDDGDAARIFASFACQNAIVLCGSCNAAVNLSESNGQLSPRVYANRKASEWGKIVSGSAAEQFAHWFALGRVVASVLTPSDVKRLTGSLGPAKVDALFKRANSPGGRKKTLALLAKEKGPHYGIKLGHPRVLRKYRAEGGAVVSRVGKAATAASKTAPKKRAAVMG